MGCLTLRVFLVGSGVATVGFGNGSAIASVTGSDLAVYLACVLAFGAGGGDGSFGSSGCDGLSDVGDGGLSSSSIQ